MGGSSQRGKQAFYLPSIGRFPKGNKVFYNKAQVTNTVRKNGRDVSIAVIKMFFEQRVAELKLRSVLLI